MAHAQKSTKGASGGKAAPKGKKAAGGNKKVEDDREETLQAVVWNT
jgi:translation initiation factor eIF-2B subunit epsilon